MNFVEPRVWGALGCVIFIMNIAYYNVIIYKPNWRPIVCVTGKLNYNFLMTINSYNRLFYYILISILFIES